MLVSRPLLFVYGLTKISHDVVCYTCRNSFYDHAPLSLIQERQLSVTDESTCMCTSTS